MEATTIRSGSSSARSTMAAPTYPLLRMTLVAMVNLSVAYATLTLIPSMALNNNLLNFAKDDSTTKENIHDKSSSSNGSGTASVPDLHTLPSLSWTLVTLFAFQTMIGLAQAHLHNSSNVNHNPYTTRKSGQGKKKKSTGTTASSSPSISSSSSTSLFGVLNTSISIGAVGTLICHVFAVLFGAGVLQ
jgi:hypothetical protein